MATQAYWQIGVDTVYELRQHRSVHDLPTNVEKFLVELFKESPRHYRSNAHNKVRTHNRRQLRVLDPDEDAHNGNDNVAFPRN